MATESSSEVVALAVEHVAQALRKLADLADRARGDQLDDLEGAYDKLFREYRKLLFKNLKPIDDNPQVKAATQQLKNLTLKIGTIKQEMRTAKKAIDGAAAILAAFGTILGVVLPALG